MDKFKNNGDEFTTKIENFVNIKWKIKGRKKILETKDKMFLENYFIDKNDLKDFYNEYKNSPSIEIEDLLDIEKLIGTNEIERHSLEISKNFSKEWEKAQIFIKYLKNESSRDNMLNTIEEILNNYPYSDAINERRIMMEKYSDYKHGKMQKDIFLLFIKGKYQDAILEINSKQNAESESLINLDVFGNIFSYLNKFD